MWERRPRRERAFADLEPSRRGRRSYMSEGHRPYMDTVRMARMFWPSS